MNVWGKEAQPFFFLIDFAVDNVVVHPLDALPSDIQFDFTQRNTNLVSPKLEISQVSLLDGDCFREAFKKIHEGIYLGNSYLCNYTASFPVSINAELEKIYSSAKAPFKLKYKDQFVCFSPERFVKIEQGRISAYPMKGTAVYENKESLNYLLEDKKEKAEHYTVVDLLRNDLGKVCRSVKVNRFRFPSEIQTQNKKLIQLSSEIEGELIAPSAFGDIFSSLLPAGSICGAPKESTLKLISESENHERGFYTGVFGVFDGETLDSAVAIRFIEKSEEGYVYKTGVGMTHLSSMEMEYQELLNKIYVPLH